MFALPDRFIGGRAATAAAALAIALLALACGPSGPAQAQGRLEAEYLVTISGLPVGHGTWVIEISDKEFTAVASGVTAGLLKVLTGGQGTGASHGVMVGGQPVPTSYAATIVDNRHIDQVRMSLSGGNVVDYMAEPPLIPLPDRIPLTDADRHGVVDPMTSTLTHVGGTGEPVSPEACSKTVPVFDGRVRYDLHSAFKRTELVKAERGYQGPTVVCALYFAPISGYVPDRAAIKYLVGLRDAEVWLAPIAGTRVLVPFRFAMPTPLGVGVMQAKQFVSIPGPPHSLAKTQ